MLSRPVRALWIEIVMLNPRQKLLLSRPVRALWIEIGLRFILCIAPMVEAREGLVD